MIHRTIFLLLTAWGHVVAVDMDSHVAFADELEVFEENVATQLVTPLLRRLKGRKLETSTMFSWRQYDANLQRKKDETLDDEWKRCEKMRDKYGITCVPSTSPSVVPSFSPSQSFAPSISSRPSPRPSSHPTRAPTGSPSFHPTGEPSETPTNAPTGSPSYHPTIAPTTLSPTVTPFVTLQLTREDGSVWIDNTCQTSLPATATKTQSEVTQFEYFLFTTPNSDPQVNMKAIELELVTQLAQQVMTCHFDESDVSQQIVSKSGTNPFEVFAVSSLPADTLTQDACPEEIVMDGADCHRITAGFTPTIFYSQPSNRQLNVQRSFSTQSSTDIFQFFGPVLQELLNGTTLQVGDVLATQYSGFLASDSDGTSGTPEDLSTNQGDGSATNGDTSTTNSAAAIQGGNNNGSQSDNSPGYMVGAIIVCLATVALLIVAAVLLHRRKLSKHFKLHDDPAVMDLDVEVDTDGEKSDRQEGHPNDNALYIHRIGSSRNIHTAPRMMDEEEEQSAATTNYTETTLQAKKAIKGLRYSVVDDEYTYDESLMGLDTSAGNDPHDYTNCRSETCFKCRSRNLPRPTFLKADLQAIQSDLGNNKMYQPKYPRSVVSDDTVDL